MATEHETRLPRFERDRIAQAGHEVGATQVAPAVARTLVAVFIVAMTVPHLAQLGIDPRLYLAAGDGPLPVATAGSASWLARVRSANRMLLARTRNIEDLLAEESVIGRHVRPVVQGIMTGWLAAGTAQVEVGTDGWLFYRPDLDHVIGRGFLSSSHLTRRAASGDTLASTPQPDPRPALFALDDALARRGITLIVMPTPVKPSAEADRVGGPLGGGRVVSNRSYARFVTELEEAGVRVFDLSLTLADMRREGLGPLYLATDTHWRPETVTRVAAELGALIEQTVSLADAAPVHRARRVDVTNHGDTVALLDLGTDQTRFAAETVSTIRIETTTGDAWQPDRMAEVLLLGDSFTNVYSLASLGWGEASGLAEQLSFALGRPVDRLSQNDDGAGAPRRLLATELARDTEPLSRTRVVVYQFAARELSQGDWQPVELEDRRPAPAATSTFWSPGVGATATIEATVAAIGAIPRPGSVPYRDHIVAVHLTDIVVLEGPDAGGRRQALVYIRSMADNELTEAAVYRPGGTIRLALEPWTAVSAELDGISRSELDEPELLLALPWWGVPTPIP